MQNEMPFVSVIVPTRNESLFIANCLDSILIQTYPNQRFEVLVVDGMSEDGTAKIVASYTKKYDHIKMLENPKRITACALNIGIKTAKGSIIIWMSSHNRYEKNYILHSVTFSRKYEADNVGGAIITLPRNDTIIGKAIVACLGHPFGVGNSFFRIRSNKPKWVDTVFGGCYKREIFNKIGMFNEGLVRGQDIEFNLRLKKAGGRTLLTPDIVSYYYARSDMKSFWKHNWSNGVWAILPFLYSSIMPVSWRHLVPVVFVISLIGSAILGLVSTLFFRLFLVIVAAYTFANLAASSQIAFRQRDFRYFGVMPYVFVLLHVAYGLGSVWGTLKVAASKQFWKNRFRALLSHRRQLC